MTSDQKYARLALLMGMVAAWPLTGLAAAGLVQFAAGDVQLRRGETLSRLSKGAELDGGDVVLTGTEGRAQIRFSDGGLVALYPDSQFTVTRYADGAGAGEDHFVVNLLRGGMRALTGLIGKRNPANYKVVTPTAVVGIRGSAFLLAIDANGQVFVSGEQDEIEVCTQAGCVGVTAGEAVLVVSDQDLPVYTHTRALLPVPQVQTPLLAGDQLDVQGRRAFVYIVPAPVPVPVPPPPETVPPPAPVPVPPPPPTGTPQPGTPAPPAPTPTTPPPPTRPTAPPVTTAPPPATTAPPPPTVRPPIVFIPVLPIILRPPPPPPPPVIR
ncbi:MULTISPECIES: FecR domain-containing protein [unclassified Acidovorax]|uniref:FecR family protein n=1 Tax=unclassified Acidovorax TaxID=2684926 RepID=UPI000C17A8D0|nr:MULTISPECIES: FecR family protein [unclassified Acidovorax]PIF18290.1 FecR family protein [Acidovorax sp. 59]PKW02684.1 FecR family protein [Acidovorax sp. 30]